MQKPVNYKSLLLLIKSILSFPAPPNKNNYASQTLTNLSRLSGHKQAPYGSKC